MTYQFPDLDNLKSLTNRQLTQVWRDTGAEKLFVRQYYGWESEEALSRLRPLNEVIDAVLREQEARRLSDLMRRGARRSQPQHVSS